MTGISLSQSQQSKKRSTFEKTLDIGFIGLTRLFAFAVAGVLIWIGVQVALQAQPAIATFGASFLLSSSWNPPEQEFGILPMIYGTIVSSLLALLLAIPVGLASAIMLSEDFLPYSLRRGLTFWVELLAAIPSVVYGLWGIFVLIPFLDPIGDWLHENFGWFPLFQSTYIGPGMLPAGIILAIMILPIFTTIARDSLEAVDPELRLGSYGVGATRWQTLIGVLIPAAFSGIVGGLMLALGRALGETMAVTLVIGNSNDLNLSLLAPANTIASLIANQFPEASDLQKSALLYAGLVLFAITLIVNIIAEFVVRQVKNK